MHTMSLYFREKNVPRRANYFETSLLHEADHATAAMHTFKSFHCNTRTVHFDRSIYKSMHFQHYLGLRRQGEIYLSQHCIIIAS